VDPIVSLQGRTIVVTGAGQGIGKGIVELAIELGANVVAVDLNGQTLDAAVSPLPQARVLAVQGSVADPAVADRAVTEAVAKFGAVHGLVNNAGIIRPAMIDKMTDQQWQEVIDVHLTGSFYWMRATGRHMVERSKGGERTGGSIVNISSEAGRRGSIGQINYAAAKAGMLGMARTWALELAPEGITVNVVAPGPIRTDMFYDVVQQGSDKEKALAASVPVRRLGQSADVARAVTFFADPAHSFVTGQVLYVCGGTSVGSLAL